METGAARRPQTETDARQKKLLLRLWLIAAVVIGLLTAALLYAVLHGSDGRFDGLYDDPEALAGSDCFSSWTSSTHHRGNTWHGSMRLSGVYTLFSCKTEGDTWGELDYTLEVTRGRAKLILTDPAGNVTTIGECLAGDSARETVRLPLPAGTSCVKLVGTEGAELSWRVEMN